MPPHQSPAWPKINVAQEGSPNVLVFLTDDVGFGACSTFGGPIPTPVLDGLAREGVRFTRFHTTGICSPTRASLLTGRTPHKVNMGRVANRPTSLDGYTSVIPKSAGTIAQILRMNGYATAMFGKNHLTPEWESSAAGPYDRWPTGLGFDYFYGFLGHDTNMWAPALVENTSFIAPPQNDLSYHFDKDIAEKAANWILDLRALDLKKPFFMYYATGTAHSPHHAPREWIDRFAGQFDEGWDRLRSSIYERQLSEGVIPKDAKLSPRPSPLPAWESLAPEKKRLGARLMESYAASLSFADFQIGNVLKALDAIGERDNTLIFFIQGDNGGSAEGGFDGLLYEQSYFNRTAEDYQYFLSHIEDIGGPRAYNHYPAGWSWALNSPFQYYKQVASHFGGTRNGLVVSWPKKMGRPDTGFREQFHHVSDLLPSILEAANITAPEEIGGVKQDPLDGKSMLYALSNANAPSVRTSQIFECVENFGIYEDGWMACSTPINQPWIGLAFKRNTVDPKERTWELYDVESDFSQSVNLAASHPDKLKYLQALFWEQAARGNILPIHPPSEYREGRPSLGADRKIFVFRKNITRVHQDAAPHTIGRSFSIAADVHLNERGNGVLVTHGGRFGGYAFYLHDGRLCFHYNALGPQQFNLKSPDRIAPGAHKLGMEFQIDAEEPGSGGSVRLDVDGVAVGRMHIDRTLRDIGGSEPFNIGEDSLTPVCDDYTIETSTFNGDLRSVVIMLI